MQLGEFQGAISECVRERGTRPSCFLGDGDCDAISRASGGVEDGWTGKLALHGVMNPQWEVSVYSPRYHILLLLYVGCLKPSMIFINLFFPPSPCVGIPQATPAPLWLSHPRPSRTLQNQCQTTHQSRR